MIFYFTAISVIFICLIIVTVVVLKKIPTLRAIDLEAMKSHKQKQVKVSIVEERLERKFGEFKSRAKKVWLPIKGKIKEFIKNLYKKFKSFEKEYQDQRDKKGLKQEDKETLRQKINSLIASAAELARQEKFAEAEKKYIEAISLDKQNIESYKGLGEVYIAKKDYEHALETFEFIKQINPKDDLVWRRLGLVCDFMNNHDKSIKYYKKAVDLVPNNPKNLDLLIQVCIKAKDRLLAQSTLKQLEEVNPDNKKIEEYRKQIEEL